MRARSEWLRPGAVALVFTGGVLGGGAREVLVATIPPGAPVPLAVLVTNLLGAFALGLLLDALAGNDSRAAARARLLWGTGLLGGFTTYSSLALASTALADTGELWLALAYGLGSVLGGALAALLGMMLAVAAKRRSRGGGESDA